MGGGGIAVSDEITSELTDRRDRAFSDLVDRHLDESYRVARLVLRDPHDAQDATHDAVVTAWRKFATLREMNRFEAWFARILVNTCRDRLRRRKFRIHDELIDTPSDATPVDRTIADREALAAAFERLNADQRIAIVLRFYMDLTVDQIAVRVNAPSGTIKSRLHHALHKLRAALELEDDEVKR
jgi:RNA polymerase sigma-70 factor (ECF subfamily)